MIIIDLVKQAEESFKAVGIETSMLDAKILLAHCMGLEQPQEIIFKLHSRISQDVHDRFTSLVNRRLAFEPIAYIVGYKCFWKRIFKVNHNVLIPRPETELMIDVVLKKLGHKKLENLHILDLGTGSGCIILSLLDEFKNSIGIGVDVSEKALEIAAVNANINQRNQRVKFVKSNWFYALNRWKKFDIIVANPPYIPKCEWDNLKPNVKNFEPSIALTDFSHGFENYEMIVHNAKNFLKKGGAMVLEIGYNQSDAISNILECAGYKFEFYKDLQGINRVVYSV
ncbi:peptide chain release factor N(5)-glutamine methyltransferase [Candidatus Bandiella euplotis]|uniref:Release factor glutamine methyltransferase n=1 Tax=Candidatus Bandiella euplotis TaxID=1664265 RepID=A0ABZ0UMY3_9RICK|nr:peptide chain release factor N(5)-glutamine methyltransferase [Candidatus Bandiella woodruffii]WPX97072.1 Release factor glutamine methyltransferase [Candidatus Bandiella woodruffii]